MTSDLRELRDEHQRTRRRSVMEDALPEQRALSRRGLRPVAVLPQLPPAPLPLRPAGRHASPAHARPATRRSSGCGAATRLPIDALARRFDVSRRTVFRILKREGHAG